MPVVARDITYFLSRFGQPPTVEALIAEMQEYEIPAANARAAIDQAFQRELVHWAPGATVRLA